MGVQLDNFNILATILPAIVNLKWGKRYIISDLIKQGLSENSNVGEGCSWEVDLAKDLFSFDPVN